MDVMKTRSKQIIDLAYQILCNKIAGGLITIHNEASMQHHLGFILEELCRLFEFDEDEHFSIELEYNVDGVKTQKSSGKARCDILLVMKKAGIVHRVAIELKYFPSGKGKCMTDNRFSILKDIENLESYPKVWKYQSYSGYMILYTTESKYSDPNTRSYVNIGEGTVLSSISEERKHKMKLQNRYQLHWDKFEKSKDSTNHYFLKIDINNGTIQ